MSLLADPVLRDSALVLRWFPVTDSSRVVVWFTRGHGRISTLIKGSQRAKSWMLGQYDLFYTCELLFYARAREDLHQIRECSPIHARPGLRGNWRACAGASFVADLLYRISPPRAAAAELYRLATLTLDQFARGSENPALLFWFELKLLADLGLAPDLDKGPAAHAEFDYRGGRVRPAGGTPHGECGPVSGGALAALRALQEIPLPEKAVRLRLQPDQIREITRHLERFTEWHLDLRLPSRGNAVDLMTR